MPEPISAQAAAESSELDTRADRKPRGDEASDEGTKAEDKQDKAWAKAEAKQVKASAQATKKDKEQKLKPGKEPYSPNYFVHMPRAMGWGTLKATFDNLGDGYTGIYPCQKDCYDLWGDECIYAQVCSPSQGLQQDLQYTPAWTPVRLSQSGCTHSAARVHVCRGACPLYTYPGRRPVSSTA